MKVCGNCGKESPDDSSFCANCGASLLPDGEAPPKPMSPPPNFGQVYAPQPTSKSNKVWMWVAIVLGMFVCICPVILAAILFPVFASARHAAIRTVSLSNVKQISLGTTMYSEDYDELFPYVQSTSSAVEVLVPYTKRREVFKCPVEGGKYDFNLHLGGVLSTTIPEPASTPMWIETLLDPSAKFAVGFIDDHVKQIQPLERARIQSAADQQFERPKSSKPLPAGYIPASSG